MPNIYMVFDFGKDEEKLQQARHKLETWKQAFRLDKKLQYKVERSEASAEGEITPAKAEKSAKGSKSKGKASPKAELNEPPASTEGLRLFVRLGFSGHEKLSEERWVQRIPSEEPFRDASPTVAKLGEEQFEATQQRFEELD